MNSITLNAPAKINLALRVGKKRPDGFHEIRSLMQAISLSDELTISVTDSPKRADSLNITGPQAASVSDDVEHDVSDNLVMRALACLRAHKPEIPPVRIELVKNIPVGAGLGGGSSDAAATLLGLNRLFDLGLDRAELSKLGATLGSDVPFFFSSGSALVSGRGELIEDIELPLDYYLALITPPERVSTAEAYRGLNHPQLAEGDEDTGLTLFRSASTFSGSGTIGELLPALTEIGNDFEGYLLKDSHLEGKAGSLAGSLRQLKKEFRALGSRLTCLSGSGSTVFGVFASAVPSERLHKVLREGWLAFSAEPISLPADSTSLQ